MEKFNQIKLPWELTQPHRERGERKFNEKPIGHFFNTIWGTLITVRQRKGEKPCKGCFFAQLERWPSSCMYPCEGTHRSDGCDVIYKKVEPKIDLG